MFGDKRRIRELEEELGRCREENRFLLSVIESLEEGVVLLEDGKIRYINESGKSILGERSIEEMGEDIEVVAEGESFLVFKRREELSPVEEEEKDSECLGELKSQLEPIFEDINRLSSQAAASFTELDEVFRIVSNGLEIVKQMSEASARTEESLKRDLELVNELSRQSEDISKILTLINEISEQTNLLALNAAIEAARAGELGRGFAVVAEEVRRLAGKTMEFTENIDRLLKDVEKKVNRAKTHIEEVAKEANSQKNQASDVEELFYLVQYRMEALRGKYEEVSSKLEAILHLIQDTRRIIESKLSGEEG